MARTARRRFSPTYFLRTTAITKGFLGGSGAWRVFGIGYFGIRLVRRLFGKQAEILTVEELAPGQWMQITALLPTTRTGRRARR